MNRIKPIVLGLGLCLGCAFQVSAIERERFEVASAAGQCQGSSAAFGSNLRNRPLSIDNIEAADQFVTCALTITRDPAGANELTVRLWNATASPTTFNCVLVNAFRSGTTINGTFTSKSVDAAAGVAPFITWLPSDITPAPVTINHPNVQCTLPGGTSLLYIYQYRNEEVGA